MQHRKAQKSDLTIIKSILKDEQLPNDDCAEHLDQFIIIEQDNSIIGLGALEICSEQIALMRSIVVKIQYRHAGIAQKIVKLLIHHASNLGIKTLYLLTESAIDYFKKHGFTIQKRSMLPEAIQKTKQYSQLCPESATVMCLNIQNSPNI